MISIAIHLFYDSLILVIKTEYAGKIILFSLTRAYCMVASIVVGCFKLKPIDALRMKGSKDFTTGLSNRHSYRQPQKLVH